MGANARLGAYSNKYGKSIKEHFEKKSSEPENPREFWNAYRLFLHGKTKQANDIITKENNVVISDKSLNYSMRTLFKLLKVFS